MVTLQETAAPSNLQFDAEAGQRLEAVYTHPDVVERRRRVRRALDLRSGERVLDIGCGPGFLTVEAAAEVGPAGWVAGVDLSDTMLAHARHRAAAQPSAAWTEFRQADAVMLPYPDRSFDAAVATQVLEYVADVPTALAEIFRVLRPGGRAVIVDTDWDSLVWHGSDPARTAQILAAWDEHLADPYLPRTLSPALRRAGFGKPNVEVLNLLNLDWAGYSQGIAGLVAVFVVGRHGISQELADAWIADLERLGADGTYFFSLDQYLFQTCKPVT